MEKVPKFKTAKEEAQFWETHSPLDFPGEFEEVKEPIIDQRGRKKGIYIRIDPGAIEAARTIGADLGIGYQTLFRMWIMEGLSRHLTEAFRELGLAAADADFYLANLEKKFGLRPHVVKHGRRPS
jgi:predicted DNA binding CopG/RHH family protein